MTVILAVGVGRTYSVLLSFEGFDDQVSRRPTASVRVRNEDVTFLRLPVFALSMAVKNIWCIFVAKEFTLFGPR